MREENVIAVAFEDLGGKEFRFGVTLIHDDTEEAPRFVDWWQAEDLEGNLMGRHTLLHGHTQEPSPDQRS